MDEIRRITWVGSSLDDLKEMPSAVQKDIGFVLHRIQQGENPSNVKPLRGFGPGIFEIVSDFNKNTYRGVYAVKLGRDIYVLHIFQKKSTQGIKTPKQEIDLINRRLSAVKEYLIKGK